MPKRLSPSMRARGRGTEGVVHVPGGITPSAIASWQTPGARAGPVGAGQRRAPPRRSSRAIVWWSRWRPWPTTTVSGESCADAEILQAYQDHNTTGEPGFRWIKNLAAIAPVWLEKPARIAALAMLTVLGLLVYSLIQRQGRLSLRTHDQQRPGNKGLTATPTAAVVFAFFAQVALIQFRLGEQEGEQIYGVQPHHLLIGGQIEMIE